MKRTTWIPTGGALLGVLLALSVASRGAQNHQAGLPVPAENLQQKTTLPASLSDEERADLFMARKSYDEAVEYYSRAIKSHPVSEQNRAQVAGLWNKMGICYQQAQKYEKARKAYKQVLRVKRDYAQAWNNLGTTFFLTRKPKKSIKFYRRAIKLRPLSASYHLNLGTAYFERRKYKPAVKEYRAAIQLDPEILTRNSRQGTAVQTRYTDARFFFYMAKIYASAGNSSEAIRYLRRAMEEGFNDEKRILSDPDIQKISKDPAFVALMKSPPVAIKD
jgi:tetratricopeptide (TPR) repeat protein